MAPDVDPLLSVDHYNRTSEEDMQLGIFKESVAVGVNVSNFVHSVRSRVNVWYCLWLLCLDASR